MPYDDLTHNDQRFLAFAWDNMKELPELDLNKLSEELGIQGRSVRHKWFMIKKKLWGEEIARAAGEKTRMMATAAGVKRRREERALNPPPPKQPKKEKPRFYAFPPAPLSPGGAARSEMAMGVGVGVGVAEGCWGGAGYQEYNNSSMGDGSVTSSFAEGEAGGTGRGDDVSGARDGSVAGIASRLGGWRSGEDIEDGVASTGMSEDRGASAAVSMTTTGERMESVAPSTTDVGADDEFAGSDSGHDGGEGGNVAVV